MDEPMATPTKFSDPSFKLGKKKLIWLAFMVHLLTYWCQTKRGCFDNDRFGDEQSGWKLISHSATSTEAGHTEWLSWVRVARR